MLYMKISGIARALAKSGLAPALVLAITFPAHSQSTVITFDDLETAGYVVGIANGYAGLDWTNFGAIDGGGTINATFPGSGYYNGIVSASNVAFNVGGVPASISSTTPFTLCGGYFTAAWNYGLTLEVQGYAGASLLYDQTNILNASGPQYITFDFTDVTSVRFISSGGTAVGLGYGPNFAVDNLTIATVPEPSGMALPFFGGAILLFNIVRVGKKRKSEI